MANETKAPAPATPEPVDPGLTLSEGTDPVELTFRQSKGVTVPVISEHAKGLKLTTF